MKMTEKSQNIKPLPIKTEKKCPNRTNNLPSMPLKRKPRKKRLLKLSQNKQILMMMMKMNGTLLVENVPMKVEEVVVVAEVVVEAEDFTRVVVVETTKEREKIEMETTKVKEEYGLLPMVKRDIEEMVKMMANVVEE